MTLRPMGVRAVVFALWGVAVPAFAQSPGDTPAAVVLEPALDALDGGAGLVQTPPAEPPAPAPAEAPPPDVAPGETPKTFARETVVTGSRIKRKELIGPAPVAIFTQEQIRASGRLNVGEFLQTIPQQSNAINRNANNGGDGSIRLNLRGLGQASTLVLLNGRRVAPGGVGADSSVDLSAIPTNVVDRIEVLADGASAVYGSDAVAGVVNIITVKKFDGAEVNVTGGVSSRGDGQALDVNGVVGSVGDKGSILVSLGYSNNAPVFAGNRDYSTTQRAYDANAKEEYRLGSGTVPGGRVVLSPGEAGVANGNSAWNALVRRYPGATNFTRDLSSGEWRPFLGPNLPQDNGDGYNFQPYNYLVTPQQRLTLFSTGEYQLHERVRVYFDSFFTKRTSTQELAPEPFLSDVEGVTVSAQNIYNPFGRDFGGVRRRLAEFGGRITTQDVNTFHAVAGLDGTLPDALGPLAGWAWDVNFNVSRNEASNINQGNLRLTRLQNALGPSFIGSGGTPTCGTPDAPIAGCVPLNLFGGPGTITTDQVEYLRYTGIARGFNQQLGGLVTFGGDLFRLWAERPLALIVGYEHRTLTGGYVPDPITAAGETSGNKSLATGGGYGVNEAFGELSIPIVDRKPGFERLELTAAGRVSAYSNFGATLNYKFGARYSPVKDVALRGTVSSAFRAPTIPELFGGQSDSFPPVTDPCASVTPGSPQEAACGAAANNGDDQTQLRSRIGGNSALRPEVARIATVGLVVEPRWVRGLYFTADYYNLDITNTVSTIGENVILSSCYPDTAGKTPQYCQFIQRDAGTQRIRQIVNLNTNVGRDQVDGIDFTAGYRLGTPAGSFNLVGAVTWLRQYNRTLADGTVINGAGTWDLNESGTGGAYPHLRFNASLGWAWKGLSANVRTYFIGGFKECGDSEGYLEGAGLCYAKDHSGERQVAPWNSWDVTVAYQLRSPVGVTSLMLGVTNLFDQRPPTIYNGFANTTDVYSYDLVLRSFFARLSHRF
ncbi:MAG: TonB-dependent receptor [Myxococcaceae bacterium]|nr:TonB-dependent receptor [Myxococcaceae bacterium]